MENPPYAASSTMFLTSLKKIEHSDDSEGTQKVIYFAD